MVNPPVLLLTKKILNINVKKVLLNSSETDYSVCYMDIYKWPQCSAEEQYNDFGWVTKSAHVHLLSHMIDLALIQ